MADDDLGLNLDADEAELMAMLEADDDGLGLDTSAASAGTANDDANGGDDLLGLLGSDVADLLDDDDEEFLKLLNDTEELTAGVTAPDDLDLEALLDESPSVDALISPKHSTVTISPAHSSPSTDPFPSPSISLTSNKSFTDALGQALKPELEAKNVSVRRVKEICHSFLHIKGSITDPSLGAPSSSPSAPGSPSSPGSPVSSSSSTPRAKTHAVSIPLLSDELRPKVWMVLLGCHNKDADAFARWDRALDLPNQKVIRMDCDRTRPKHEFYENDNGAKRDELELLLTFYCKSRGVSYKQGLNEILAPFLVLFQGFSHGQIVNCFYSLISKFLPSIFNDKEFESLQCIMRLFNLLLLYHEPTLSHFLNQFHMLPELYATAWFITLFARKVELPVVYALWDVYIMEGDPFLHYFVALALLIENRQKLLTCEQHKLPQVLGSLNVSDLTSVKRLVRKAIVYRSRTPMSFRQQLYKISFQIKTPSVVRKISSSLETLPCINVPAEEVVQQCYHQTLEDGSIKYLVLDCRTKSEFTHGRLPCAIHLPPSLLEQPEEMMETLQGFAAMKGCHFCLLGPGQVDATPEAEPDTQEMQEPMYTSSEPTSLFLIHFLQKGFPHMSRCKGGYAACHRLVEEAKSDLVDHKPSKCQVCSPGWDKTTLLGGAVAAVGGGVKALSSSLVSGLRSRLQADASKAPASAAGSSTTTSSSTQNADTDTTDTTSKQDNSKDDTKQDSAKPGANRLGALLSWGRQKANALASAASPDVDESKAGADVATTQSQADEKATPGSQKTLGAAKGAVSSLLQGFGWGKSSKGAKPADEQPTEVNASVDLSEWKTDPNMLFFSCRRVFRDAAGGGKLKSRLSPRILAITEGYIIALEPLDRKLRRAIKQGLLVADPTSPSKGKPRTAPALAELLDGPAHLKNKHRISELKRITSKKSRPQLLTFHWKKPASSRAASNVGSVQLYLVDECRACIFLVKRMFALYLKHTGALSKKDTPAVRASPKKSGDDDAGSGAAQGQQPAVDTDADKNVQVNGTPAATGSHDATDKNGVDEDTPVAHTPVSDSV